MANFGQLKAEIAADITRSDLTTQINQAVLDAIEHHSTERFWFNETRAYTFATAASDGEYESSGIGVSVDSIVAEWITIDWLKITVSGATYFLERIPHDEMEDFLLTPGTTGSPAYWSYYNSLFFLSPIPAGIYTVRVAGHYRLKALSADADTNAWTTHGRQLIRSTARLLLYAAPIKDAPSEVIQVASSLQGDALTRLRVETSRRLATGKIRPWE